MSTLEGLEAIYKASTTLHGDGSSGSSSETSSGGIDHEPISASAPRLLSGQPTHASRQRQQSADLDMLNSHRQSMAAETGQLTPRVRKPGQSRDSSVASIPASIEREYFASSRKPSNPAPPETASPTSSFSTPKIDALPAAIRRSSMPDVTPFAQFCQTAPPTPRLNSSRPGSQASSPRLRALSDAHSVYTIAPVSPLTSNPPTPPPEPAQPQAKRTSFEKRESQVVRGEGSGFEILKPGSLKAGPPAEHPMQRQRAAAPPISLHNAYRPRSSSADSRRKLQKRRRPSIDSQTSSENGRGSML
ncbi:hypothetical protein LTR08_002295 [Meristemomyces frigidus]|nr:hypothetical protein LTR08_002295 [Meristemomyces frigidus]